MNKLIQYYVEGECEEKFINILKLPPFCSLKSGKVVKFNVIQEKLSSQRILSLKKGTIIIFVYDTDVKNDEILKLNISLLNKYGFDKIYHIQSIENFEDEIVYSCDLNSINNIFKTKGSNEFKSKFLQSNNIMKKLNENHFQIIKMWIRQSKTLPFKKYKVSDFIKNK